MQTLQSAPRIVILGAGPAGLGAAWKLARRGFDVTIVERGAAVGGNAGSFDVDGIRVDYGSHRLHPACAPEILGDIRAFLGDDLLDRPRHGRILLSGHWLHFPLKPLDLALHAPPSFLAGALRDLLIKPPPVSPETFASVLERGLGRTICHDFYFPYARKIWGLDPEQLDPEQARRRVSAGSIGKLLAKVARAVPGLKPTGAGRFFYPRLGYGQICDAYAAAAVQDGARFLMESTVTGVESERGRVATVLVRGPAGDVRLSSDLVLSTIPVPVLASMMQPAVPDPVAEAARGLRYRAMILLYVSIETDRFTEYDAHYLPGASIPFTRMSEPKNYGLRKAAGRTVLCAELPCERGDAHWNASGEALARLLSESLDRAGIPLRAAIRQVEVRRLPQAYPLYTLGYQEQFARIDEWLSGLDGLVTFGRQGLFAHDNTHHALAMAYALDECLDDAAALDRDKWAAARRHFESFVVED